MDSGLQTSVDRLAAIADFSSDHPASPGALNGWFSVRRVPIADRLPPEATRRVAPDDVDPISPGSVYEYLRNALNAKLHFIRIAAEAAPIQREIEVHRGGPL